MPRLHSNFHGAYWVWTEAMRRPVKRAFTAVVMLVALVFSQMWLSAYACPVTSHSASMTATDSHGDLRNHHTDLTCHSHCNNHAQPDHAAQPAPTPLVLLPLIWGHSSIPALAIEPRLPPPPAPTLLSASPPSRILFQVFRT
jgi:hypothetical protein